MITPTGDPVYCSNGGYISDVSPSVGAGPGILELNHWYVGNEPTGPLTAAATTPVHWRIPIATTYAMPGVTVSVTLPRGSGFAFTSAANIAAWGAPYFAFTWTNPALSPSGSNLSFTIPIGDLAANSGVVIAFTGGVPAVYWFVFALALLVGVTPVGVWGPLVRFSRKELSRRQALVAGLTYFAYQWYAYLSVPLALARFFTGRNTWKKTRRNSERHVAGR